MKFGIIGTNWITDAFIEAAQEVNGFELTAVYSRTKEKAEEFAGKYGVETTFTNLEAMAASNDIEAVYIASPNAFHAEHASLFLKNKKHVLCEKPVASNAKEASKMFGVAKENNVLLMEALKSTLLPNFKVVEENLHKLGKIRRYFASYCQYSSRYDAYKEGTVLNAFNPQFSNGSIMDIGVYCIYPLVVLFGKPESVKATGVLLESGVDGEGSVVLKYKDMDAVVMYSKITNSNLPAEIQGEDGNLVIDKIHTPEKVEIFYRNGEKEELSQPQKAKTMFYEAEEFIRLAQEGETESETNSIENSITTMEIIDEIRKQIGVVFPSDGLE
ncbi:putative dehydrogenase [Bacillus pakistanensis]|uniref:Dehydrogenase n=1 Tax=Rossellomorea pakistanensis TaxID=992288 RepID=A0ABS2NJT4_9BACI|nr:Gfo/Idh/MocA family oxidoreductase [Bacillus pakistanensis]MBM7588089.1 putative dehydrogenase [Bacillus pakistanensis]